MGNWYEDAIDKLDYADYKINALKYNIENNNINSNHLTHEVNNIIAMIRSPLDYFAKYSAKNIGSKAQIPNFPFGNNITDFDKRYDKNICINNEELKKHFEKVQLYNGCTWLYELNKMNNNEKHQKINKTIKNTKVDVGFFQHNGVTLNNVSFINVDTPIVENLNGVSQEVDLSNARGYKKETTYTFEFNKRDVFMFLKECYSSTLSFIEEGRRIIESIE